MKDIHKSLFQDEKVEAPAERQVAGSNLTPTMIYSSTSFSRSSADNDNDLDYVKEQ